MVPPDTWIFDLDNTLYPPSAGLVDQMNARIRQYLCRILSCGEPTARRVQSELCAQYGTTLRGLMVTRGIDPAELLAFEHDIDYSSLAPDPGLAQALSALPGRKLIMTNAVATHAEIVLDRLGIIVDGVFDLLAADLVPKPNPQTYARFVERFGVQPAHAVMVDDLRHNLDVPRQMGMRTIWLDHGSGMVLADLLTASSGR